MSDSFAFPTALFPQIFFPPTCAPTPPSFSPPMTLWGSEGPSAPWPHLLYSDGKDVDSLMMSPYDCTNDWRIRRKNASKDCAGVLKSWLRDHQNNPYPSKRDKMVLAIMTNMSFVQVSTWFANARRRLKKEGVNVQPHESASPQHSKTSSTPQPLIQTQLDSSVPLESLLPHSLSPPTVPQQPVVKPKIWSIMDLLADNN